MEKKTVNRVTQAQQAAVFILLHAHCRKVDGFAVYDPEWDDHRVLAEVNAAHPDDTPLILSSVAYRRSNVYGPITTTGKPSSTVEVRLMKTERNLNVLQSKVDALVDQVAALIEAINNRAKYVAPPGRPVSVPPSV